MSEPGALDAAWEALQAQWEDDGAHARFLRLSQTLGALSEAGMRYRRVREEDPSPERRAKAAAQTERLIGLALSQLEPRPARDAPRLGRLLPWVALLVSLSLILSVAWSWLRTR